MMVLILEGNWHAHDEHAMTMTNTSVLSMTMSVLSTLHSVETAPVVPPVERNIALSLFLSLFLLVLLPEVGAVARAST
jgi:capsular polysaccharide biosynthesis protein